MFILTVFRVPDNTQVSNCIRLGLKLINYMRALFVHFNIIIITFSTHFKI